MPLAQEPNQERHDLFRDLAHTPLRQVQGVLDTVNCLTPAERDSILRRRDALLAEREERVLRGVSEDFTALAERAERAREETGEINDAYDELVSRAESGLISAGDFEREYAALEHRLNNVNRTLARFGQEAESIRVKEEDPEAWLVSLERRFPLTASGLFGPVAAKPDPTSGGTEASTEE